MRGGEAELRGTEPAGQSAGTLFKEERGECGGIGGAVRGAQRGDADRAAGHTEGGRSLCAAGPGVSRRAAEVHGGGREDRCIADQKGCGSAAAAESGEGGVSG